MATIERFEDLAAWKQARTLARRTYEITRSGAIAADPDLRDRLRRSSVAVMARIAEGFESRTVGSFLELLGRARGAVGEVRAQLYAALDTGCVTATQFDELAAMTRGTSSCILSLMDYLSANGAAYRVRRQPSREHASANGESRRA